MIGTATAAKKTMRRTIIVFSILSLSFLDYQRANLSFYGNSDNISIETSHPYSPEESTTPP